VTFTHRFRSNRVGGSEKCRLPGLLPLLPFVLRAGLPQPRLAAARSRAEQRTKASGRFSKAPKRFVAQEVLQDLGSGDADDDRLVAAIITALCKGTFPDATPDGLAAIEGLKAQQVDERTEAAQRREELQTPTAGCGATAGEGSGGAGGKARPVPRILPTTLRPGLLIGAPRGPVRCSSDQWFSAPIGVGTPRRLTLQGRALPIHPKFAMLTTRR
jgi:hypothetical protein